MEEESKVVRYLVVHFAPTRSTPGGSADYFVENMYFYDRITFYAKIYRTVYTVLWKQDCAYSIVYSVLCIQYCVYSTVCSTGYNTVYSTLYSTV